MSIKAVEFARTENILDLETKEMAGILAGICYLKEDFEDLVKQDLSKHTGRGDLVAGSGHHSCYCHEYSTVILTGVPKIVAMVINSLRFYNTSEKSGRYTVMNKCSPEEKVLYDKWVAIFKDRIKTVYPDLDDVKVGKLAQENARKMLSVFTPTVMAYTTSIQQWNYILDWCDKFYEDKRYTTPFYTKLADALKEFRDAVYPIVYQEGLRDNKDRGFESFLVSNEDACDIPKPYFGTVYNTTYKASFDEIAQCERHRVLELTMHYDGYLKEASTDYGVPVILRGTKYEEEWLEDILLLKYLFPQGMLVTVEEKGTFMSWRKSKCLERDCGNAQLDIMLRNKEIHAEFMKNIDNLTAREQKLLLEMNNGPRCTYPDFKCAKPCVWGAKNGIDRLI